MQTRDARRLTALLALWLMLSAVASARTLPVEIGDRVGYTYRKVFTIAVPAGWRTHDQSEGRRAVVAWTDRTGNGAIQVMVTDSGAPPDAAQQKLFLSDYARTTFGRGPQFRLSVSRGPTGWVASWTYLASGTRQGRARLAGRSHLFTRGNRLAVVTVAVPADQLSSLSGSIRKLVSSFRLLGGPL